MREILFRGKRIVDNEWYYGSYLYPITIVGKDFSCTFSVIIETVSQFTGLYDKNGKKIFEGDILRNVNTEEIGYVDYEWHGCPNFVIKTDDGILHYTTLFIEAPDDNMEIIGNIYDNPDLIPVYKESEYQEY